ncbi:MAG: glucokinase [Candidatus Eisenbacteria bacterium]|nr:glucokinase [Candidatus Eisenbacteria bacterium]
MRILAGDIGGTKALFAFVLFEGGRLRILHRRRFASGEAGSLAELAARFLAETGGADRAAFGAAGPVAGDVCAGPNLPWAIDRRELARALHIPRTVLMNDLEAVGYGIEHLDPDDLFTLQEGVPVPEGPIALVGAGTGLGEAFVLRFGETLRVFPTEGGHADFAPRDEIEFGLLRFLKERIGGRVSVERVLSGSGLAAVHDYVAASGLAPVDPAVHEGTEEDPAAVVSGAAIEGRCGACVRALDLFVSIYGAEAGNQALRILARGGVYLAGGIAPRILNKMKDGVFLRAFLDKGRFAEWLRQIPVRVILADRAPLLGAASRAARLP